MINLAMSDMSSSPRVSVTYNRNLLNLLIDLLPGEDFIAKYRRMILYFSPGFLSAPSKSCPGRSDNCCRHPWVVQKDDEPTQDSVDVLLDVPYTRSTRLQKLELSWFITCDGCDRKVCLHM